MGVHNHPKTFQVYVHNHPKDCNVGQWTGTARCLKITEKVSFNIASEASYVYILSGKKLIKNAKNGPFWRVFENLKLAVKQCYQTGQKLMENAKIQKFKCVILSNFQTMWESSFGLRDASANTLASSQGDCVLRTHI